MQTALCLKRMKTHLMNPMSCKYTIFTLHVKINRTDYCNISYCHIIEIYMYTDLYSHKVNIIFVTIFCFRQQHWINMVENLVSEKMKLHRKIDQLSNKYSELTKEYDRLSHEVEIRYKQNEKMRSLIAEAHTKHPAMFNCYDEVKSEEELQQELIRIRKQMIELELNLPKFYHDLLEDKLKFYRCVGEECAGAPLKSFAEHYKEQKLGKMPKKALPNRLHILNDFPLPDLMVKVNKGRSGKYKMFKILIDGKLFLMSDKGMIHCMVKQKEMEETEEEEDQSDAAGQQKENSADQSLQCLKEEKRKQKQMEDAVQKQQKDIVQKQQEDVVKMQEEYAVKKQQEDVVQKQQGDVVQKQQEDVVQKQQGRVVQKQKEDVVQKQQEDVVQKQQEGVAQKQQEHVVQTQQEHVVQKHAVQKQQEDAVQKQQEYVVQKQQKDIVQKQQGGVAQKHQEDVVQKQQEDIVQKQQGDVVQKQKEEAFVNVLKVAENYSRKSKNREPITVAEPCIHTGEGHKIARRSSETVAEEKRPRQKTRVKENSKIEDRPKRIKAQGTVRDRNGFAETTWGIVQENVPSNEMEYGSVGDSISLPVKPERKKKGSTEAGKKGRRRETVCGPQFEPPLSKVEKQDICEDRRQNVAINERLIDRPRQELKPPVCRRPLSKPVPREITGRPSEKSRRRKTPSIVDNHDYNRAPVPTTSSISKVPDGLPGIQGGFMVSQTRPRHSKGVTGTLHVQDNAPVIQRQHGSNKRKIDMSDNGPFKMNSRKGQ